MRSEKSFSGMIMRLILSFGLLAGLFCISIFFIFLPIAKKQAIDYKKSTLRDLTATALSVAEYYHKLEVEKKITPKEAKRRSAEMLRRFRYGKDNKSYFWIIDLHGRTIMHPYTPELEGKSIKIKGEGDTFLKNVLAVASSSNEGFVRYRWYKNDDRTKLCSKISDIRVFTPWSWIIGTGAYFDDIEMDMASFSWFIFGLIFLIIGFVSIIFTKLIKAFISSENKRRSSFEKLLMKESKIRALLDAVPDMILRIDREGVVLDVKEPMDAEPFIDPIDLLDAKINETWDKNAAEKVIAALERVFITSEPQKLIFDYPLKDGGTARIESHYAMSGKNEILATFRDITGRCGE